MAHSANIISSIKLPNGTTYEIHDAQAIHSIEDLGLSAALVFKGTLDSTEDLYALTGFKAGYVYLIGDTEYVAVKDYNASSSDAQESFWEELGNVHDAASSTHKHNVTVTGTNAASAVTGKVQVPTVSSSTKYLTFEANGTAKAITALNTATIKNPSAADVTASKVSTSSLLASASVTNGVLSFGTATVSDVIASKVSTSDVTVATGAKTTADALTGGKVTSQTATSANAVSYIATVSTGTTYKNLEEGSAAAQVWTQTSGTTGTPIG